MAMSAPSLAQLCQNLILRAFQEHRSRRRFAVLRTGERSWRLARDRFLPALAPGFAPVCTGCLNCACSPFIVCAIHPQGPETNTCRDYQPRPPGTR